jgi:DinB superfamily
MSRNYLERFITTRQTTEHFAALLQPEDMVVQAMEDTSPAKWHLAHTTWFFEAFILVPHFHAYQVFHPDFQALFNSYYVSVGPRWQRERRGIITRPTVEQTFAYRAYVNKAMEHLLALPDVDKSVLDLVELGLQHEQQHQELLVTDIKYLLAQNPFIPQSNIAS